MSQSKIVFAVTALTVLLQVPKGPLTSVLPASEARWRVWGFRMRNHFVLIEPWQIRRVLFAASKSGGGSAALQNASEDHGRKSRPRFGVRQCPAAL